MSNIRLEGNDGGIFEIAVETARSSTLLSNMLDMLGGDGETVPLHRVDSRTLKTIIEWMNFHKTDPSAQARNAAPETRRRSMSAWDAKFISDIEQGNLLLLISAADYLDVKLLLDLACMELAARIENQGPQRVEHFVKTAYDIVDN